MARKNVHQYEVTSPLFGKRVRRFDTKTEMHTFLHNKILKMAKAHVFYHRIPRFIAGKPVDEKLFVKQVYRQFKRQVSIRRIKNMDIRSSTTYPSNKGGSR